MSTAVTVVGLVVIGFVMCWAVLITVQFLRALQSAHLMTERVHARQSKQLDKLLDRFMAMDFERFKSYELASESQPGGFEAPEEQTPLSEAATVVYSGWGSLDQTLEKIDLIDQEERLVSEDFPDENR
jgi:hypothetical protein